MPSLLAITSSPRGEQSISNNLVRTFVDAWKQANEGGSVKTRDLPKTDLPFVSPAWMAGSHTPVDQHSPEMKQALAISDELIAELKAADHIVLGTPMYNFAPPAIVKAWIDHVVRLNETFNAGYEGLLKNKKATIIIASSGVYTPGSAGESANAESAYLRQIFAFMGINDIEIILAGGGEAVNKGEITLPNLLQQFEPAVTNAVQQ
jgi:FMN-dependent NADH-azoreductase